MINDELSFIKSSILWSILLVSCGYIVKNYLDYVGSKNHARLPDIDILAQEPVGTYDGDLKLSRLHLCARILGEIKNQLPLKKAAQICKIGYTIDGPDNMTTFNIDHSDVERDRHAILISESLLNASYTQAELKALLAHEVNHVLHKHVNKALVGFQTLHSISNALLTGSMPLLLLQFSITAALTETINMHALQYLLTTIIILKLASMCTLKYLHSMEYTADKESIVLTKDKKSLISALTKIETSHNKASDTILALAPIRFFSKLGLIAKDHPSLASRTAALGT